MKKSKIIWILVGIVLISACTTQEAVKGSDQAAQGSNAEIKEPAQQGEEKTTQPSIQEPAQQVEGKTTSPSQGLGTMCSREEECLSFCAIYRGECEKYCNNDKENEVCQKLQINEADESNIIPSYLPSCGDKTEFFTAYPLKPSDLEFIRPLGFIGAAPEHIYPTGHNYFFLKRDSSGHPIEVPVYSPGDVWITRVKEIKMERPVPDTTDYSIFFSPCREFVGFYSHLATITEKIKSEIKPPFRYCQDEEIGRFKLRSCEKYLGIKLSAGELMGTVGQLEWHYSFDLGAYDMRTPALNYAAPSRYKEGPKHIVCPLDYFKGEVKDTLKSKLGENDIVRTIKPICGEVEQDEPGTAQGVWFVKDAGRYARPELSLIHDFIDPTIGAFAFGFLPAESGLSPDVLHFTLKNEGLANRDFKDVTDDGNIYCYDRLVKQWSYDKKLEQLIILIQLTSPTTLRIQGKESNSCGSGPWAFSSHYAELER